ncbi:coproporphyrinogen dehydrogenase HemZ [Phosphitispora sp. TUW77]|uniref:coproporphyrinogen dehydrogenase HemZ n=1 Tax=Phosphitispora sp. TUW77 TaxID=3152361 RepID=UPI003AB29259
MIIELLSDNKELAVTGQDVVRLFYPDAEIRLVHAGECEITLKVAVYADGQFIEGAVELIKGGIFTAEQVTANMKSLPFPDDLRNNLKRLVKLALFRLLSKYTGQPAGPWGILTGIRPTKIVHRLLDEGWRPDCINQYLTTAYDMSKDKAELLIDIALRQRIYLLSEKEAGELISIYIGIPFCPTRCAYCSFPSYPVENGTKLIEPFLEALACEIKGIGKAVKAMGLKVQTIYVGGGTPTVLSSEKLLHLLDIINNSLVSEATVEITLEAGRPDTITIEKLKSAREQGVARVSINPQTTNPGTLEVIGRRHSVQQVADAVAMARLAGFNTINMDVIIGLPGETTADVENTMSAIAAFEPENLTVHTMAVKRASRIIEAKDHFKAAPAREVEKMLYIAQEAAVNMGMKPYYLYRQKNMVSPLENVGYTRSGHECVYNIQMIEERQTVIGLGGGAGSKFVKAGTWYLTSHYNPKDPDVYISRINEIIAMKVDKLRSFD